MKVTTLNKKLFRETCQSLFSTIEGNFDVVIGILNGGGFVLDEYKMLNCNKNIQFRTLKIQRDTTSLKSKRLVKSILSVLPYSILDHLRVREYNVLKRKLNTPKRHKNKDSVIDISFYLENKKDVKKILILDDALDSGKTLEKATKFIKNECPDAEIKTAVIVWTNEDSLIKPNYFLHKNALFRFPWSLDYKTKR